MKTITIEKGQVAFYSSLSTDTLVVNGILKVNGTLKGRRLLGRGIVDARRLEADTVSIRTGFIREVEIGSGVFGELYGTTCKASAGPSAPKTLSRHWVIYALRDLLIH